MPSGPRRAPSSCSRISMAFWGLYSHPDSATRASSKYCCSATEGDDEARAGRRRVAGHGILGDEPIVDAVGQRPAHQGVVEGLALDVDDEGRGGGRQLVRFLGEPGADG